MTSFSSIAPYYDLIFPYKKMKGDFIESFIDKKPAEIIDIGCATGALTIDLNRRGHKTTGIDLDTEMIGLANKSKALVSENSPDFFIMDMLQIDKEFPPSMFDFVSCLGNTLVHLQSLDLILDFLRKVNLILKPGGKLVVQIVNYDRIMKNKSGELPFIETDEVAFSRKYVFHPGSPLVEFQTRIVDKRNSKEVVNSSNLRPVLSAEMSTVLKEAGFIEHLFCGDFKKTPYSKEESPALIASGVKT